MIKVLHYGLSVNLGGIETYLYKLYQNVNRKEFEFDFLVYDGQNPCFYEEFSQMGSRFYKITSRNQKPLKNRMQLKKLFRENNFDVVHCHLNTLSYIAPVLEAIKHNVPVIVHSRNAGTPKSTVSNMLHKINSKIINNSMIEKVAVSSEAGKWLFGSRDGVTVINNGIEVDKYKYNKETRDRIRKDLNLEDDFVIVHLGALREQKNHIFLLKVFKELLKYRSHSKLILIGDGDYKDEIIDCIQELNLGDNVLLLGNRDDTSDLLSAGDFFLFPSFFEGFPNAVLEAETSGLPCLVSDTITKEVLINDNCTNYPLGRSADEWARKVLSMPSFDNRFKAIDNIKNNNLTVEQEVKKMENIYYSLVY